VSSSWHFPKPLSTSCNSSSWYFFCLKVKLLKSSWFPKINWIRAVDKKSDICSNGVEQLKNCVEQFFWAIKFRAVDHLPLFPQKYVFVASFPKRKFFNWAFHLPGIFNVLNLRFYLQTAVKCASFLLHWAPLNVITDNVIIRLMLSIFSRASKARSAFWYSVNQRIYSDNVFSLSWYQSDNIKRLPLLLLFIINLCRLLRLLNLTEIVHGMRVDR
jgi:hypothetical protein